MASIPLTMPLSYSRVEILNNGIRICIQKEKRGNMLEMIQLLTTFTRKTGSVPINNPRNGNTRTVTCEKLFNWLRFSGEIHNIRRFTYVVKLLMLIAKSHLNSLSGVL